MDLQARFAIFTAVGVASFSAGLSLTTACSNHADAQPEKITIHPALPTEMKPLPPLSDKPALKATELSIEAKPSDPPSAKSIAPSIEKEALAPDQIAVRRLVVTHAVSEHEPIEPAELVSGTPILAFVELSNQDATERNVVVTFEREGRPAVGHVKLHVPAKSPRFRTWARTRNLHETGTWEAVIRSENGTELGRQPFELDPA
ncbi:MAG TPA: DUF2914 domain-containing protein [Polyangiaceae bacterium]|nr:DUF2914 domain-containing protein [Polyangiaceae bacterium]